MAHALDSMVRTTCEEPLIGPLSRHEAEAAAEYAQEAFNRITHNVSDVLSYVRFSTAGKGKEKVELHQGPSIKEVRTKGDGG